MEEAFLMRIINKIVGSLKKKVHSCLDNRNLRLPKVFYCHVPKCAGMAISEIIRRRIFSYHLVGTFGINLPASQRASQVMSLDMMSSRELILSYHLSIPRNHFGSGHVFCRPKLVDSFLYEWDFVTILRNPINRWISEFVYNTHKISDWAKNTKPIDDYLLSKTGQIAGTIYIRYFSSMPRNYIGNYDKFIDEAVENLGRFSVVGTLEKLDEWRQSFKAHFGKNISISRENVSPNVDAVKEIRSNDSLMRKIELICEPDLRVYQRVVESFTVKKSIN
jgi:hypothetical protein